MNKEWAHFNLFKQTITNTTQPYLTQQTQQTNDDGNVRLVDQAAHLCQCY